MLWLLATAHATSWTVDATSLLAEPGSWPVLHSTECAQPAPDAPTLDGEPLVTLGVAVVVYSRKHGTMAWGHSSLRVRSCVGGQPRDHEYETYRMGRWNEQMLRDEHPGAAFLEDAAYLRAQRGSLVLFRNADPVDGGWYAESQARNREIYELWLELPQAELDAITLAAEGWYADQRDGFDHRAELTERYIGWTRNCTTILKRALPEALQVESALPFRWLRELEATSRQRVLHPSAYLWSRWDGEPPTLTSRPHPVFR